MAIPDSDPYRAYFYRFEDLPDRPTDEEILQTCPPGVRRLYAFERFMSRYPDDVSYVYGYLEAYANIGLYDDYNFNHCYEKIALGLSLADPADYHKKIRDFDADIRADQQRMHEELGPSTEDETASESENNSPRSLFDRGEYRRLEEIFESARESIKPVGILGSQAEKDYWVLYQYMIEIAFAERDPALAMMRLDLYEQDRIAVRLTPTPNLGLQETVIGHLAQRSLEDARRRLQFWLDNSKMPCIDDIIKYHPAFADMFEG